MFGFLFEEYATVQWDNDTESLIDAYLTQQGLARRTGGGDDICTRWAPPSCSSGRLPR